MSFTRRYASRRVDQDLGTDWGPRHDQRLTHRHEPGADSGLLYVYDPTWGEYAVLAEDVSLHAVQQAIAQAAGTDPLPPVSAVADFLRAQQHQTTRHVTPDVVAAGPGAQVQL